MIQSQIDIVYCSHSNKLGTDRERRESKIKELNFLKVTINIQGQKNNEIRNWTTGYS